MEPTATLPVSLDQLLDRLARFEPTHLPVISLYLNLQADQHGKDNYQPFVRKELPARVAGYPAGSEARESLDKDVARIEQYLANEVAPSANGLALFACAGLEFFEAVSLEAPMPSHRLSVAPEPHLYPLELLLDQHPPHAVVLADAHSARIFVFAQGAAVRNATVEAREKIKRSSAGGWSQMRYQRHMDEIQAEHARELVSVLDRMVRDEGIAHVIIAGDDINTALIRGEMGKELTAKLVDVLKLETRTPEQDVMRAAAEALRRHDANTDLEAVEQVIGDYQAGGLGVVGRDDVLAALERGQVSELLLTATAAGGAELLADQLVAKARQTSATMRFIEDPALLEAAGGVAAALRYRLDAAATAPPGKPG